MSWSFTNGADMTAVLAPGAVPQNGTPISAWMMLRPISSDQGLLGGFESGSDRIGFLTFANALFCANSGVSLAGVPNGEWMVLGYDDNNAGGGTVRYHMCTGLAGTPTWVHGDGPSTGDRSGVVDVLRLGTSFGLRTNGHIAAAAVADSRLGDAGFEALSLTQMSNWVSQAVCAWQCNVAVGATALLDLTGNGANQTSLVGTPVLDGAQEPPNWTYFTGSPFSVRLDGVTVPAIPKARFGGVWIEV